MQCECLRRPTNRDSIPWEFLNICALSWEVSHLNPSFNLKILCLLKQLSKNVKKSRHVMHDRLTCFLFTYSSIGHQDVSTYLRRVLWFDKDNWHKLKTLLSNFWIGHDELIFQMSTSALDVLHMVNNQFVPKEPLRFLVTHFFCLMRIVCIRLSIKFYFLSSKNCHYPQHQESERRW